MKGPRREVVNKVKEKTRKRDSTCPEHPMDEGKEGQW